MKKLTILYDFSVGFFSSFVCLKVNSTQAFVMKLIYKLSVLVHYKHFLWIEIFSLIFSIYFMHFSSKSDISIIKKEKWITNGIWHSNIRQQRIKPIVISYLRCDLTIKKIQEKKFTETTTLMSICICTATIKKQH